MSKSITSSGYLDFGLKQDDINKYVEIAFKNKNKREYLKFANTREKLINDVREFISDINVYVHALRDNDIRHIKNSHGMMTNEKYPVTESDIELIPYIVNDYDKVFVVNHNGKFDSIYYVKVLSDGNIYYLEQATNVYGNEKLLVNKQMVKTGENDIPAFENLKRAIIKKEGLSKFLADINNIRGEYAQSGVGYPSMDTIAHSIENSQE